jgi:hypothetical protein
MTTSLLLLALAGMPVADPTKPEYEFALEKSGDSITLTDRGKQTVFVIKSKSGIGDGSIKLKSGEFPNEVVLRFEYVDRGDWKILEAFGLTAGRFHVAGSKSTSGAMRFYLADARGKVDEKNVTGTLNIAVKESDKGLEVYLPANLLLGVRELGLSWIDAFRR